jgi:hypothetical protein
MASSVWDVFVCDATDCPWLNGAEGMTVHATSTIHLSSSMESSRLVSVLGHELVHVCFSHMNEEARTGVIGCEASESTKAEERLAVFIGPNFVDGLQRAGFLKLPKVPR